jgi:amidase
MGDGEVCGTGFEIRGSVRIRVDIARGCTFNSPVVENENSFFFLASSPEIETAVRMVTASAVEYIKKRNSISWIDAYMLASLGCDLMFSQVVNPWKTVKMRVGKELLK